MMAFSQGYNSLTIEEIREHMSDAQIAAKYLGITRIPCVILSPLRRDTKPSLGLYTRDGVSVCWTDFATKEGGSIYTLLSKMWHCSFSETLERIRSESGFSSNPNLKVSSKNVSVAIGAAVSDLQCRVREWRPHDIAYWESYGVPLRWLKYAEVYPISHKIIVKQKKKYVLGADRYAYVFVEHKDGKITLKIYQPFNKNGYKWSNKHDKSVISLWTKIPKEGDKLCICSSVKDALCLWANTGVPAVAVQGEGYGISNTALQELKRRFKEIYILFDNDEPGLADGLKLAKATGFTNVVLPPFKEGKDVSDFYKSHKEEFKQTLENLLNIKDA